MSLWASTIMIHQELTTPGRRRLALHKIIDIVNCGRLQWLLACVQMQQRGESPILFPWWGAKDNLALLRAYHERGLYLHGAQAFKHCKSRFAHHCGLHCAGQSAAHKLLSLSVWRVERPVTLQHHLRDICLCLHTKRLLHTIHAAACLCASCYSIAKTSSVGGEICCVTQLV